MPVTFSSTSTSEHGAPVGEVVGLVAYRIVQEALSNAIRHAPGSAVEVRSARGHEALELVVRNSPGRAPAADGDGGYGLIGMVERAASVGGTVRTGATEDGGFEVMAVLPLRRHPAPMGRS
jgi:signal transduction histidine kinase